MPFLLFDAIKKSNCLLGLWFHSSIHFLIVQLLLYIPLVLKVKVLHFSHTDSLCVPYQLHNIEPLLIFTLVADFLIVSTFYSIWGTTVSFYTI